MKETSVGWFQNILGILDYFESDQQFSDLNGWASISDAGVLQAINDGWMSYKGGEAIGPNGEGSASQLWESFFRSERSGSLDARSKWGIAEQAGVDYGVGVAAPLLAKSDYLTQQKAASFVELGNAYRFMVANNAQQWPLLREFESLGFAPLDPRTTESRLFVNLVADGYVSQRTSTMPNTIREYAYPTLFCTTGDCVEQ